jgi:hypothetical protein
MTYLQEDEKQRSFAYYNETGKIIHHPTGRPAVCKYIQMITVLPLPLTESALIFSEFMFPSCKVDLFAGAGGMSLGMEKVSRFVSINRL